MMELDEGKGLLTNNNAVAAEIVGEGAIDNCINNPKHGRSMELALCLAMGNAADAVEIMCVGFIMSDISHVTTLDKELLSAAVFLGMLFGGILGGYFSDRIGRKRCLMYSLALNSIAGFASAFSPNIPFLIFCRVIGGLGIGGSVPIVFSLGAEIFPASHRGHYLSVIASFWMVGAIFVSFSAWIMLGDDFSGDKILPHVGWRWFAGVSAIPALIAFLLTHYKLVESPRYLFNKGLYEEACEVLNGLSTVKITVDDLQVHRTTSSTAVVSPLAQGNSDSSAANQFSPAEDNQTIKKSLNLLFGKEFRTTTLTVMAIWFTLSFGSYGISTWISILFSDVGIGNAYAASFIFAIANLPGNLISLYFIDTFGRRWLLSVGMCLAGLSTIGFALDTKDEAVVVLFASLFNAFSVIGWNSLDCLSAEGFPTVARSSAMGLLAASGRIGAIAGQFVNGSLENNIPLLLFVTSACSIFGGCIAWLLPEDTAGKSLGVEIDRKASVDSKQDVRFHSIEDSSHSATLA